MSLDPDYFCDILCLVYKSHNDSDDQEDDTSFCVSYDGGHHPEYASNVFSEVSAIWEKNGHIYLEVEEENQYEINRIDIYSKCFGTECHW